MPYRYKYYYHDTPAPAARTKRRTRFHLLFVAGFVAMVASVIVWSYVSEKSAVTQADAIGSA